MHEKFNDARNGAFMNITLLHIIFAYHILLYLFISKEEATLHNTYGWYVYIYFIFTQYKLL